MWFPHYFIGLIFLLIDTIISFPLLFFNSLIFFSMQEADTSHVRLFILLTPLYNLRENCWILDLLILSEQQYLADNLRRFGILVSKRKEQLSAMLTMNRQNTEHGTALLMDNAAPQMN